MPFSSAALSMYDVCVFFFSFLDIAELAYENIKARNLLTRENVWNFKGYSFNAWYDWHLTTQSQLATMIAICSELLDYFSQEHRK